MEKNKPKPSSLAQQIKAAQKEWAKMSPEQRAGVVLQGSSEPTQGSLCQKDPNWCPYE
jgi:hypothetical protein